MTIHFNLIALWRARRLIQISDRALSAIVHSI